MIDSTRLTHRRARIGSLIVALVAVAALLGPVPAGASPAQPWVAAPDGAGDGDDAFETTLGVERQQVEMGVEWTDDGAAREVLLHAGHDHAPGAHTGPPEDERVAALLVPTSGVRIDLPQGAAMVILESADDTDLGTVAIRSLNGAGTDETWSEWTALDTHIEDAPDGLAGEEGSIAGVSAVGPIWVGDDAQAVEIARLGQSQALVVESLTPSRQSPSDSFDVDPQLAQPSRPSIIPRSSWTSAGWAFDNDTCENGPTFARNLEAMVVHHTVTTNSYGADSVAGMIEGIRRFHVNTRGWCDIAYNFVVDRFGRIWEARIGGIEEPVIGGHTRGFNTATSGIAVLGTHSSTPAPQITLDAIAALADWKLGLFGADPLGTVWLKSRTGATGPLRYPNGTWVESPRLVGHRELVLTSCPGNGLHPNIPSIRARMAATTDDIPYTFPSREPLDSGPALFVVDTVGGIRPAGAAATPSPNPSALATGTAVAVDGGNGRGFVLSSTGDVIGFGGASSPGSKPAGGATAVDLVASDDGSRGWVLDSTGTLHGFNGASDRSPSSAVSPAVAALLTDDGSGYVLDGSGGLHAVGGGPSRSIAASVAAVDLALRADGESGWVLDVAGRLHPFGGAPEQQSALAGAAGSRARAVLADPTDRGGWVLDSEGRLFSFGQPRDVQPLTTTVGNPTIVDAGLWWHLPTDLAQTEDAAYTQGLFTLFLGRPASLTELDYWSWRIHYEDRAPIAEGFATSDEWAGVIVSDIYTDVLGRPPEPEGRAFWVQRLRDGVRTQDLGASFYSSPEYVDAAGSNAEYVRRLYRALLHREADQAGLAHWVGLLDSGQAVPGDIASGFYQSVESRNDRVTRLYQAVLGRAPDVEGRDFWAGRLLVEDDIALAVDLAVSDEFYDRLTEGLD